MSRINSVTQALKTVHYNPNSNNDQEMSDKSNNINKNNVNSNNINKNYEIIESMPPLKRGIPPLNNINNVHDLNTGKDNNINNANKRIKTQIPTFNPNYQKSELDDKQEISDYSYNIFDEEIGINYNNSHLNVGKNNNINNINEGINNTPAPSFEEFKKLVNKFEEEGIFIEIFLQNIKNISSLSLEEFEKLANIIENKILSDLEALKKKIEGLVNDSQNISNETNPPLKRTIENRILLSIATKQELTDVYIKIINLYIDKIYDYYFKNLNFPKTLEGITQLDVEEMRANINFCNSEIMAVEWKQEKLKNLLGCNITNQRYSGKLKTINERIESVKCLLQRIQTTLDSLIKVKNKINM